MPDETPKPEPTIAQQIEAEAHAPPVFNVKTAEPDADRLVPVSESIRYRKRAQAAEKQLDTLQTRVNELTGALAESERAIAALERRQRIDAMLCEADAVDLEAARLLTEAAVAQMDDPDVALAVTDLCRQKPHLFRRRSTAAQAMGVEPDDDDPLHDAAMQASTTGDRRDLLRYLRLRRTRP